jgi:protein disulfide-isomerase
MKKLLSSAAALLTCTVSIFAAEADIDGAVTGKWTMDFEAAKSTAAEKQLPVLINFSGSDWCHWCKLMESNVFATPAWQTYASSNLLMVLIDFPQDESLVPEKYRERNKELSTQFGVEGFPTFVLLDSDGTTELGKLQAGQEKTPTSFEGEIEGLLKNSASAQRAYADTLSPDARKKFEELTEKLIAQRKDVAMQEAAMLAAQQKMEELNEAILQSEDDLREFRVVQLSEEEQKTYEDLKAQFDTKRDALMAWIQTQPERNEANQAKFDTMQSEIQEIALKLQAY